MANQQLTDSERLLQFLAENPCHSDQDARKALGLSDPNEPRSDRSFPRIAAHRQARMRRELRRVRYYHDGGEMQFA